MQRDETIAHRRAGGPCRLAEDRGGVSVIAGMAAMTIGVLAAAGIVVGVMMDHARSVPGPNGTGGPPAGGVVVGGDR